MWYTDKRKCNGKNSIWCTNVSSLMYFYKSITCSECFYSNMMNLIKAFTDSY